MKKECIPSKTNTNENPKIKTNELITTFIFILLSPPSVISFKETPDINEIYAGTKGKTQGEIKDISPAAKAAKIDMSGIKTPFKYNKKMTYTAHRT